MVMQNMQKELDMEDMHQKPKNHDQGQKKKKPEVKWDMLIISNGNLARLQIVEETRVIERFKSLWKEKKEIEVNQRTSSSSRTQPQEEFFSPERERVMNEEEEPGQVLEEDDEDKLPVFEDFHLKDLIDLRIKQIQQERGEEFTPIDEVEKRKIKVTKKTQTIFEIPLPTKIQKWLKKSSKCW